MAIVIGWLGGKWLDEHYGTGPWLTTVGILVGVAAGFRELYRVSRRYQRELRADQKRESAKDA